MAALAIAFRAFELRASALVCPNLLQAMGSICTRSVLNFLAVRKVEK